MISVGEQLLTQPPPIKTRPTLLTTGSHQRSRCCLCHEAGVPGSCGRQLREIDRTVSGCAPETKLSVPSPQSPSFSPRPLSTQMPNLPLPQPLLVPPGLT